MVIEGTSVDIGMVVVMISEREDELRKWYELCSIVVNEKV